MTNVTYLDPPQCTNSYQYLLQERRKSHNTWECHGFPGKCKGGELYELALSEAVANAVKRVAKLCEKYYGKRKDDLPIFIWIGGKKPVCIQGEKQYSVYLTTETDQPNFMYQICHEMFHVSFGGKTFHWTHEMLAETFAITMLRKMDYQQYADLQEQRHNLNKHKLDTKALVKVNNINYPAGLYDRAYEFAKELKAAFGEENFKKIISYGEGERNIPNMVKWLDENCKLYTKYPEIRKLLV